MRLLLFSDSHGQADYRRAMESEVRRGSLPDAVLFAGDAGFFTNHIFEDLPYYCVRGNCDYGSSAPDSELVTHGEHRVYLTHGHLFRLKLTLDLLASKALSEQARIAVYGHTHKQGFVLVNGVTCVNPGALKNGEYAFLELLNDGRILPDFRKIDL